MTLFLPIYEAQAATILIDSGETLTSPIAPSSGDEVTLKGSINIDGLNNVFGIFNTTADNVTIVIEEGGSMSAVNGTMIGGIMLDNNADVTVAGNITVSGTDSERGISLSDNARVIVEKTSTIRVSSNDDADGINADDNAYVEMHGTLIVSGEDAEGITVDENSTVINTGTIILNNAEDGQGIDVDDNIGIIINYGTVTVNGDEGEGLSGRDFAEFSNYGTITVNGDNAAIGVQADDDSTFRNVGTVTVNGEDGDGVNFDDRAKVYNYGTIISQGSNVSNNFGVEADDDAFIYNEGVIKALGCSVCAIGVDLDADSTLENRGTIESSARGVDITSGIVINDSGIIIAGGGLDAVEFTGGDPGDRMEVRNRSKITGNLDGGGGGDDLIVIHARGLSQEDINSINALVNGNGTFTLHGEEITSENFENLDFTFEQYEDLAPTSLKGLGAALDDISVPVNERTRLVLAVLDRTGEGDDLRDALANLSSQDFQHLYTHIAFNGATQLSDFFDNYQQGQGGGFNTSGFSVLNRQIDPRLTQVQSRLLAMNSSGPLLADTSSLSLSTVSLAAARSAELSAVEENKLGAFITGHGYVAEFDNPTNYVDGDYFTTSLTGGVDYGILPNTRMGAFVGYAHTHADVDAYGSRLEVDSMRVGSYARWKKGDWFFQGLAAYAYSSYDNERSVIGGESIAYSNPEGHQLILSVSGGKEFFIGEEKEWKIIPITGVQYTNLYVTRYTEDNAGTLNLSVDEQFAHSLRSRLGLGVSRTFTPDWGVLTVSTRASWHHEFMDDPRNIGMRFNDTSIRGFDVQTEAPERDFALLGLGVNGTLHEWEFINFFFDTNLQVGQDDFIGYSASGGIGMSF